MAKQFKGEREMKKEKPELLDIVKIDGRWAQAISDTGLLLFLDTGEARRIDWSEYQLMRIFSSSVEYVMKFSGQKFKDEEIQRIHWGPEQEEHSKLKLEVTVFGEYERK